MHLDKYSKKVLKYLIDNDKPQSEFTLSCNIEFKKVDDKDKIEVVMKCLDILVECNCVKMVPINFSYNEYSLTNFGRNYFKISFENTFYKYWYPIITASIAFVLNLLISLLSK